MPDFERIISSTYPFSGKLIKVRVDQVELRNGRTAIRELVEHRGAVAVVAIQGNRVLLERQYRHSAGSVMWEIPAGTLEGGETPLDCAARELREETGYTAQKLEELLHFYLAIGYSTEVMYLFLATGLKKHSPEQEEDETIEAKILPIEKALEMVDNNEIKDAKTIIGLLLLKNLIRRTG